MAALKMLLDPTKLGREAEALEEKLRERIVGQDVAIREIVDVYHKIDHEGCAVVFAPNQPPRLNADCPIVHKDICTAYYGLVEVFVDAKQWSLAQQTRSTALKNYSCPPESFNKLLATAPAVATANQ